MNNKLQAAYEFGVKLAKKLTTKARNQLPDSDFVFPKSRRFPVENRSHAINAMSRSSGKPEEAAVRAKVHAKYPSIGEDKKG